MHKDKMIMQQEFTSTKTRCKVSMYENTSVFQKWYKNEVLD